MAERLTVNQVVVGSNPTLGAMKFIQKSVRRINSGRSFSVTLEIEGETVIGHGSTHMSAVGNAKKNWGEKVDLDYDLERAKEWNGCIV